MSRCDDILELLYSEPADGDLSPEVMAHIEGCAVCRACYEDLGAMGGALRALEPPALPDGFELSLRRRLNEAASGLANTAHVSHASPDNALVPVRRRWMPALVALAASVLLVAGGVVLWQRGAPPSSSQTETFHRLTLSVRATTTHHDAAFSVELPAAVRLAPGVAALGGGSGAIRWSSDLRPGTNKVSLPLVASGGAGAETVVTARVTVDGRTVTRRVPLALAPRQAGKPSTGTIQIALAIPAIAGDGRRAIR